MQKEDFENHFHSKSVEEIFSDLKTSKKGLSEDEAIKRFRKFGANEIPEKKDVNPFFILLKQFNSFLIYILIVAAIISYLVGHFVDVYVIVGVILLNASIGFFQNFKAERAIKALKKLVVPYAKVYREWVLEKVRASELVVGDIIQLEEGDRIPGDARLIEVKNFRTMESSLTGESLPVDKFSGILSRKTGFADRKNMVWMGTFVVSGRALAVIVSTGGNTAIGTIAEDIGKIKTERSHFQKKTDLLAKQMAIIAIIGALVTFLVGYFVRGLQFVEIFLFTIASLVSGIPEGLPAVLAIVLAMGARRMAKRNAIIRNLPATETLGVVSVIVTDKTGTLTENTLDIEKVVTSSGELYGVSGDGWNPKGEFYKKGKKINPLKEEDLKKILRISKICNRASLFKKEGGEYGVIGDPTEAAFAILAEKARINKIDGEKKIDDMSFDSELRYRASLSELNGKKELYVIGAPEEILKKCKYYLKGNAKVAIDSEYIREFSSKIGRMSGEAIRVLALAYKPVLPTVKSVKREYVKDMIFAGFVGMRDPPRKGVREAVNRAKRAGIRILMVTGDHKETALAIAKEVGIANAESKVVVGDEIEEINDKELDKIVRETNVFARLTPNMKLRIAGSLQRAGQIVAMTGDGVNDAPALKKADIGISMGIIGTDVARESSEIVLADDNFSSIVNAIEEGRIVFKNTRQASFFLVTTNFAEDVTVVGTLFLGMPLPLLPTQLLWLNLVTDGVSGVSLAMEPGHNDVLDEKPRSAKENILNKDIIPFVVLMFGLMAVLTILFFKYHLPYSIEKARTAAFSVMAFTQLFNFLNMRSLKKSVFKIGFMSNKFGVFALGASVLFTIMALYVPFFQGLFNFVSLGFLELVLIIGVSSLVLWGGEIYKFFRYKKHK